MAVVIKSWVNFKATSETSLTLRKKKLEFFVVDREIRCNIYLLNLGKLFKLDRQKWKHI